MAVAEKMEARDPALAFWRSLHTPEEEQLFITSAKEVMEQFALVCVCL